MRAFLLKYAPYLALLILAVVLVTIGLFTFVTTPREVDTVSLAPTSIPSSNTLFSQNQAGDAPPLNRPRTPRADNPSNSREVAVRGEFGNGGIWNWDDINNLLGVYGTYGAYVPVNVNGRELSGVPLSYLLSYAEMNEYAHTVVMTNEDRATGTYSASALVNCAACAIALDANDKLVVSLPGFDPALVPAVYRIDAYIEGVRPPQDSSMPVDSQSVRLTGNFQRGGDWKWQDIVNLMGVYGRPDELEAVTLENQRYTGVPLRYLFEYSGANPETVMVIFYDRHQQQTSTSMSGLMDCEDCIIARTSDGFLSLVLTGRRAEVMPQLAVIEVR